MTDARDDDRDWEEAVQRQRTALQKLEEHLPGLRKLGREDREQFSQMGAVLAVMTLAYGPALMHSLVALVFGDIVLRDDLVDGEIIQEIAREEARDAFELLSSYSDGVMEERHGG